jgi:hypothetical protein
MNDNHHRSHQEGLITPRIFSHPASSAEIADLRDEDLK